jgi:lysophospholipase L1-like esterase
MLPLILALSISQAEDFSKWEKDIAAIEKKHADAKPGGIVFAGSSSIVKWDVKKSFPDWAVYNCGFGGSVVRQSTHFAPRIIVPLKPATIIFYAGDNDINAKRTPEQVRDDFKAFVKLIHKELPKTVIYYIPIKPSVKRWEQYDLQKKANAYVMEMAKNDDLLKYIDIVPLMFGSDGKPDPALFVEDGLHLSAKGYAKWNDAVKAALKK